MIQALSGQDVYENVAAMDVPGFDIITANIGDAKHPSLTVGANLVASAAAQFGKKRILAESFALAPFNYGYGGMKRTSDWLFACGINMIVPLGFLTDPQTAYMPVGAKEAITRYNLIVTYKNGKRKFENVKYARLRDVIGTQDDIYKNDYVIPYFDTAERPTSVYPVKVEFSARIKNDGDNGVLLFDRDTIEGGFRLLFNVKEINKTLLKPCRVYDVHNYCFMPEWEKENVLEIVMENAGEFDGIGGEIYLMKSGSV